ACELLGEYKQQNLTVLYTLRTTRHKKQQPRNTYNVAHPRYLDVLTPLLPKSIVKLGWLKPRGCASPSFAHESSEFTDVAAYILRSRAHRDSPYAQPDGGDVRLHHPFRSLGSADPAAGSGNGLGGWVLGSQAPA